MPVRQIVHIDEEKCDGCGDCVPACAEGAIQIINGKAKLISDRFCDGLGACLGNCPQGAITIESREAADYDEAAVQAHLEKEESVATSRPTPVPHACPGSQLRELHAPTPSVGSQPTGLQQSQLRHWPVQLMLVPPHAPFLKDADLVVCADCAPFVIPDFHARYLSGRAIVVGCPKLDDLQFYYEKLMQIFQQAKPSRITVLRMEVPCCGGLAEAAVMARNQVAGEIPLEVHTLGIRGGIEKDALSSGISESMAV